MSRDVRIRYVRPVSRRAVLAGVFALGLAGCAATRPDLEQLYRPVRSASGPPPVVVIPGLLGSRLVDEPSGREYWPGGLADWLRRDFDALALPPLRDAEAGPRLEAAGITDSAVGRDFYGRILQTLEVAGGYVRGHAGVPPQDARPRFYVYAYDWRRDNVESARGLDRLIEQIRVDHGQRDLRVDVVAHSMGGLIVRYFARYGTQDVLDGNEFPVSLAGESKLRRVVLLGTPNLGSVKSLHALLAGFEIGLIRIPPEIVATMPSAYQLLPHAITDWIMTADGRSLDRDQFDVEIWRRFEWGVFDPEVRARVLARPDGERRLAELERSVAQWLERGRRFTWSLTVPTPGSRLQFAAFGGVCRMTPARIVVDESGDDTRVALQSGELASERRAGASALFHEPGDGTVTKSSLLGRHELDPRIPRHRYANVELDYPVFMCEEHSRLTGNASFQDNLLHYLLSADPG